MDGWTAENAPQLSLLLIGVYRERSKVNCKLIFRYQISAPLAQLRNGFYLSLPKEDRFIFL